MSGTAATTRAVRPPAGFRDRWSTVGRLRLHALESLGGQPARTVVLLPGLVTASRSMVPLARALVSSDNRVLILDPPGFGYSGKPRRALSVTEQAGVVAEWLDAVVDGPARMLGNSFGCQIAAAVAAGYPGAVGRLVLVSPTVAPRFRRRLSWLRGLPRRPVIARGQRGRRGSVTLAMLHRALGNDPPLRVLNVVEYACASIPRSLSTLRYAVLDPIEDDMPRLPVPTLIMRGAEDRLSSPQWARRLASLAPDGRLATLPGLGHDAFSRDPASVAAVAGPFLSACR